MFGDRRADEHGFDPAGAERGNRPCSWNVVLFSCNRGVQRGDRGPFVGGSANPGLWRHSRNCDRRCVLGRQPNGISSRLSSTPAIARTSPQKTKPRSQRRRWLLATTATTATKDPICDSKLMLLRLGPCWCEEQPFSRHSSPKKSCALAALGSAGRLQGSAMDLGFVAVQCSG